MKYFVHDTSIVDNGAIIGNETKIWHWSHISSSSIIGNNLTPLDKMFTLVIMFG